MSNLDNIIADIENVNRTYDFWIRDENGNIKDDIICGNIIPFLKELKNYEVDMTQEEIEILREDNADIIHYDNTYNVNANIDHDFEYDVIGDDMDNEILICIMVHRFGDIRGNYTDWAVCKFESIYEFFELESTTQTVEIDNRYVADICIFNESYYVWDYVDNDTVGCFYEIEKENLLEAIKENHGD